MWYNGGMNTRVEHDLQGQLDVILSPQEMTHPGIAGLSVMEDG